MNFGFGKPLRLAKGELNCQTLYNEIGELTSRPEGQGGGSLTAPLVNEVCDHAGPTSLVAGAEAGAAVSVEVFIEQQVVTPMGVFLELFGAAIDGTPSIGAALEEVDHAVGNLF